MLTHQSYGSQYEFFPFKLDLIISIIMIIMSVFVKNLKNSFLIILLRLRFQANQKSHIFVSYHFKNGQVWPKKADTVYVYRVNNVEIPSKYLVTFFMQQTLGFY